jgi:branched-chain amino acid transport system substrate-binding protein
MTHRNTWLGLACGLLAVVLWGSGPAVAEDLKIGVIAPLSGPGAGWGLALRAGAELAAEDVNAKGGLEVAGKKYKVSVIAYDDKYQAQGGADAANRLVFLDKVKYIVGPMGSAPGLAAQEFTEPNKIILIGDSFTTKLLGPKKLYTFRTTMTTTEFAPPMIKWIKQKYNLKRWAFISSNDESGKEVAGANLPAHKAAGHEIVFEDYYERGTTDFMPLLSRLFAQKPDAIDIDGAAPGDGGNIVKQVRQMGFNGLISRVGGPGTPEMIKIAGPKFSENVVYYSPIDPYAPAIVALKKRYEAKFPPPMNAFTPQFYDGTLWLFDAMKRAGTVTDTESVMHALEHSTYEALSTGLMQWTGKDTYGINRQVKFPFYVCEVKDGKEVVLGKVAP